MKRRAWMLMLLALLACGCGHAQVSSSAYYERDDQHGAKEGVRVEMKEQF